MKIRMGFVSNSSSSSFLIAYKGAKPPCECCGRSYETIVDALERSKDCGGDNEIKRQGLEDVLEQLTSDLEAAKRNLRDIEDPVRYRRFWFQDNQPTQEAVDSYKEMYAADVKRYTELIKSCKKLDKDGYDLADISISNHSEYLRELFAALRKAGNIIVLEGEDDQ